MNRATRALVALAGVLAAALAVELLAGGDFDPPDAVSPTAAAPAAIPPAGGAGGPADAEAAEEALAELENTVLARPLFSPNRRPATAAAAATDPATGTVQTEMPRLAGVIVGPGGRRAIFAPPPGTAGEGHSLVVSEGGSVGGYVVRAIAPGRVTLSDADHQQVLRPSHAKETPP